MALGRVPEPVGPRRRRGAGRLPQGSRAQRGLRRAHGEHRPARGPAGRRGATDPARHHAVLRAPPGRRARRGDVGRVHAHALHPELRPRAQGSALPLPRRPFRPERQRRHRTAPALPARLRGADARGRGLRPRMSATGNPERAPAARRGWRSGAWLEWLEQRLNLTDLFSFLTHFGLIYTPIDTRKPLREVLREIGSKPMVSYARWPHILGLLTAILFGLEAVSGVLLTFYYQPTAAAAYGSTRLIVRDVPLGWLVHHVHAWGAYLLVAVVFLRLMRLFWDGLYRAPREVLWFAAVALGWTVIQLDF